MAAITDLIVFGDSLSDVGNAYAQRGEAAFACPPHWRGRRCDGPVWVERLTEALDLPPLRPSLHGGRNHAFGGARSGEGLSPKGMPNLLAQVRGFLETEAGGLQVASAGTTAGAAEAAAGQPEAVPPRRTPSGPDAVGPQSMPPAPPALEATDRAPASALVVLRAGANDYLDAPPTPALGDAVNRHLIAAVEALADAGLRRFLVPSELPWGFSPIQLPGLGEAERQGLNALIARQNAALRDGLAALAARRGLHVLQPDFHARFLAVRADPQSFGFTEIARPVLGAECGGAPEPPADAAGHLWWDSWAHLTAAFHSLMAQEALALLRAAERP